MYIVHISSLDFGGIGRLVTDLANEQSRQGHKVNVFSPLQKDNFYQSELLPEIEYLSGKIKSGFSFNLVRYFQYARRLKNFDCIHFHSFNVLLLLFSFAFRKRVIYTEHGTFQIKNQTNSLKNIVKKYIVGRILLQNIPRYIVFNSNWLMNDSKLLSNKSLVVYNGIRLPSHDIHQVNISETCQLIYAGRMVKKKRIDRLINTLALLPNQNFHFHLIGSGDMENNLKQSASQKLAASCFTFHGRQGNMISYYQKAELFLLGTSGEPFGLVILEAIVNGVLPLIFEDAGGACEIVENIHPKLICKNEQKMAENILFWHQQIDIRKAVLQKLFERVKDQFSVEEMTRKYLHIYSSL